MSSIKTTDSPQLKVIQEMTEGFNKKDAALFTKHLQKDFRYKLYPKSLGIKEQSREEWIAHMMQVFTAFASKTDVGCIRCQSSVLRLISTYPAESGVGAFYHRSSREGRHSRSYPKISVHRCMFSCTTYLRPPMRAKVQSEIGGANQCRSCTLSPTTMEA